MSSIKKKEKKETSKEIYFMIIYKTEKKLFPKFKESDFKVEIILKKEVKGKDGTNYYDVVIKLKDDIKNKYDLNCQIGEQNYLVSFEAQENTFVYDVKFFKLSKIFLVTNKEAIEQNVIHYGEKFKYFLEALENNKEEDKIEKLYKDTILLYSNERYFNLLIPLFAQIYKNKELCPLLMEKFKEMNIKIK